MSDRQKHTLSNREKEQFVFRPKGMRVMFLTEGGKQ